LTIPHDKFNGEHPLPVTEAELKHVHEGDGYVSVSLSKKKLQHIRDEKEGGFLGLLKFLPGIVKGALAISTLAGAVNKNKADTAASGASGSGIGSTRTLVCQCPACGCSLQLKGKKGKGLYLRPHNSAERQGYGLITAIGDAVGNPASGGQSLPPLPDFVKNIPILGDLASLIY